MSDHPTLLDVSFHVAKERYGFAEDKAAPTDAASWQRYAAYEQRLPFALTQELDFAPDRLCTPAGERLEPWVTCLAQPILPVALRDPCIARDPAGGYLLCGTEAVIAGDGREDFTAMLRLRLWRSNDGADWQNLGVVWDIGDAATCRHPERTANAWSRWARFDGSQVARGLTAPRIHFLKGTWWITCSLAHQGSMILKSTSGQPQGPYEHAGLAAGRQAPLRLTTRSGTPSLFADDDGSVHAVWDAGWIARLDDDLAALAEPPRLLQVTPESPLHDYPLTCGTRGAQIVRMQGRYVLIASEVNPRLGGNPCHDTFCAVADQLHGPYSRRRLLVPHGGPAQLFTDEEGRWYAACAGDEADRFARCRNRAHIVPLYWDHGLGWPMRRLWCVTEDGPISRLKPGLDTATGGPVEIRDPQALHASDGWYYVAGTHRQDGAGIAGVRLWRSRDLQHWDPVRGADGDDFVWKVSASTWASQKAAHKHLATAECRQWGAQPFEHRGTFYIPFMTWPFHRTGILRSVSGRPEGPYEETGFQFDDGAPHLFRDDDGTVWIYFCFGPTRVAPLNEDLSDFAGPLADVTYHDDRQQGYEGSWILKKDGKYLLFQSDWWGEDKLQRQAAADDGGCCYGYARYGTYDWMVSVADHIRGPYGPPQLAVPHGGTCSVIRDAAGRYQATVFGGDSTAPFACSLGVIPLDIRLVDGVPQVTVQPPAQSFMGDVS